MLGPGPCSQNGIRLNDNERVVFNVGGNKYRLLVKLWFPGQVVWIKFIGTHGSYDRINVKKL